MSCRIKSDAPAGGRPLVLVRGKDSSFGALVALTNALVRYADPEKVARLAKIDTMTPEYLYNMMQGCLTIACKRPEGLNLINYLREVNHFFVVNGLPILRFLAPDGFEFARYDALFLEDDGGVSTGFIYGFWPTPGNLPLPPN